ncbi:MAG: nitronate monooxygenase [Oligoflexia bacterium]|nr:nitronate monooxygenase [Oligoflexia bacterium]
MVTADKESNPRIIQGGMGIGISSWNLARAVSMEGHLGVVSGTGIDSLMIRTLQMGDPGAHYRRALHSFPFEKVASKILKTFFVEGGINKDRPFAHLPLPSAKLSADHEEIIVAANFAEVFLAKEDHNGIIGINLLEKLQLTNLPSLFGAMLGGVDYVLMGAGIPREIPGVLDRLALNEDVSIRLSVLGATSGDDFRTFFSPKSLFSEHQLTKLKRPRFLAIISSAAIAMTLAKKASGRVDGFIVEGPTAGGHNAPPRSSSVTNDRGEPVYGEKDSVDLDNLKKIGLPFWLAGSYCSPEKILEAIELGACGVQIGSAFALTDESGLAKDLKEKALALSEAGDLDIFTDPHCSPTQFPFKIARIKGTLSDENLYKARKRICDIGYLRQMYKKDDGTLGYRCPAEPESQFTSKGGNIEDTRGRHCLCNGLLATLGLGNLRSDGSRELPLVTLGDDAKTASRFEADRRGYIARNVLKLLE